MIDPEKVLEQAVQGPLPATWRVFRGRGSPVGAAIFLGIFTLMFVGICEVMVFTATNVFGAIGFLRSSPPDAVTPTNLLGNILPSLGLWSLLPVCVALGVAWLAASRAARVRDSILILVPEGVVQCEGYSNPARRSFKVINYEDLTDIELRLRTSTSSNTHTWPDGTVSMSSGTTRTTLWLEILHRNGNVEKWLIDRRYGRPEMVAQNIIEGYAQYNAVARKNLVQEQDY